MESQKKGKAFVKKLAKKFSRKGIVKAIRLFKGVLENLPKDPLMEELKTNQATYEKLFKLHHTKNQKLRKKFLTVTNQNKQRSQSTIDKINLPYNLYDKKHNTQDMWKDEQHNKYALCFLQQNMANTSLTEAETFVSISGKSDLERIQCINSLSARSVSSLDIQFMQKTMKIFFRAANEIVKKALARSDWEKLDLLKAELKTFLVFCFLKLRELNQNCSEKPDVKDLMAAIISLYYDLIFSLSTVESQKRDLRHMSSMLFTLGEPELILDIVLQQSLISARLTIPLLGKALQGQSSVSSPQTYTKIMGAVARIKKGLGEEKGIDIVEETLAVAAPKDYMTWLQEQSSDIVDQMPVTKHFKGVQITQFLLKETSEEFMEDLLDLLSNDELIEEPANTTKITTIQTGETNDKMPLFFVDKRPDDDEHLKDAVDLLKQKDALKESVVDNEQSEGEEKKEILHKFSISRSPFSSRQESSRSIKEFKDDHEIDITENREEEVQTTVNEDSHDILEDIEETVTRKKKTVDNSSPPSKIEKKNCDKLEKESLFDEIKDDIIETKGFERASDSTRSEIAKKSLKLSLCDDDIADKAPVAVASSPSKFRPKVISPKNPEINANVVLKDGSRSSRIRAADEMSEMTQRMLQTKQANIIHVPLGGNVLSTAALKSDEDGMGTDESYSLLSPTFHAKISRSLEPLTVQRRSQSKMNDFSNVNTKFNKLEEIIEYSTDSDAAITVLRTRQVSTSDETIEILSPKDQILQTGMKQAPKLDVVFSTDGQVKSPASDSGSGTPGNIKIMSPKLNPIKQKGTRKTTPKQKSKVKSSASARKVSLTFVTADQLKDKMREAKELEVKLTEVSSSENYETPRKSPGMEPSESSPIQSPKSSDRKSRRIDVKNTPVKAEKKTDENSRKEDAKKKKVPTATLR